MTKTIVMSNDNVTDMTKQINEYIANTERRNHKIVDIKFSTAMTQIDAVTFKSLYSALIIIEIN